MTHDVFICYVDEDKVTAEAVCALLERRKLRCWFAARDILPGTTRARAVIDAIDGSRALILVYSSHSNLSPQVLWEVKKAVRRGLPVIPYRIEDIAPSGELAAFLEAGHWLDALTPPVEDHLSRLADTVDKVLSEAPLPSQSGATKKKVMVAAVAVVCLALIVAAGYLFLSGHPPMETGGNVSAQESLPGMVGPPVSVLDDSAPFSVIRADLAHTGVFTTWGPHKLNGTRMLFDSDDSVDSEPVICQGKIYFGSTLIDLRFRSLDLGTGKPDWSADALARIWVPPAIRYGMAFVVADDYDRSYLYALDLRNGKMVWKNTYAGEACTAPTAADGLVFFVSNDSILYAMDPLTGVEQWRFNTNKAIDNLFQWSSPAIADGTIYLCGSQTPYVFAVDIHTGRLKWKTLISEYVQADLSVAGGIVYVPTTNGSVFALDGATGRTVWKYATDFIVAPAAVTDDTVYVTTYLESDTGNRVIALDARTGDLRWEHPVEGWSAGGVAVAGDVAYIGCNSSLLYALDCASGRELWTYKFEGQYSGLYESIAIDQGILYIVNSDGKIYEVY
ncbi:MAG TPA: toll/interleukin-1 receptor domain-containing protein [Methanocella sp.]|jgi:outer membrane protein assembly factor BamB